MIKQKTGSGVLTSEREQEWEAPKLQEMEIKEEAMEDEIEERRKGQMDRAPEPTVELSG